MHIISNAFINFKWWGCIPWFDSSEKVECRSITILSTKKIMEIYCNGYCMEYHSYIESSFKFQCQLRGQREVIDQYCVIYNSLSKFLTWVHSCQSTSIYTWIYLLEGFSSIDYMLNEWKYEIFSSSSQDIIEDFLITDELTTNIALRKSAWQTGIGWNGQPSRVVDGNKYNRWSGNTCSHTDLRDKPYWAVDLGASHTVTGVSITNRADCCSKLCLFN